MGEYKETIEKLKAEKRMLEESIAGLIGEFCDSAGVDVGDISLVHRSIRDVDGVEVKKKYVVTLDICL